MATSREYFRDESFYESEASVYEKASHSEEGFYGPGFLYRRYVEGKSPDPIFKKLYQKFPVKDKEYFYFDEQVALGFWLRRKMDGSEDEVWDLVKTILDTYDSYPYEK